MALKLNWKNTQLQPQPTTAVAFALATGDQRVVPESIFPMSDGLAPIDAILGHTFDTPVGTVDVDYSFGAPVYGLYNGTDHTSRLALEISSASGGVASSDLTFLDPAHASFGIYLQYRIVEGDSGTTVSIMRKGGDHVSPAVGDVTWQLHYDETTHRVYMALAFNSTDTGALTANAYVGGTVDDACLHWLYAKVNFVNQTVSVFGDTDAGTSTSITTMIEAIENSQLLFENIDDAAEIGANSDLNANDNPVQLAYMAILRGSSSDRFTQADGDTLWKHGKCQNIVDTGTAIAYARTSRVGYPIAADKVAMWSGSAGGGDVQVPLEFNENWGGDDTLSLGCHPSTVNLLGDANDFTAWTTVTAAVNEAELVSERGFREMDVVDATSNGGYIYKDITGLTAATTYRMSYYARTDTGSHTARAEVTQNDLSTTLASLESALTTTRGRKTFTFTTQGGQTSTRVKLFGGTAATQTNTGFHCVMVTEGTAYGPNIYNDINQDGTTETLAVQTQVLTVAGNELTSPDEGSIWAAYIQSVQDTGSIRKIVDIHSDAENEDRRFMEVLAAGTQDSGTYNASGVSYQATTAHAALTADAEYNRSMKWRRKANLAAGAYTLEDDITAPGALTQTSTGTANTEGTGGHVSIFIACDYNDLQQLSGLQSLHLYAHEVRSFNIVPAVQTQTTVALSSFSSDPGISNGITDHGALTGLADDDHTQYITNVGTRLIAGQAIAHTTADNNTVLTISKIPAGAQSGSALQLTTGANLTGPALSITNDGSGDAISVSPDTDQSVVFGRAVINARTTDVFYLSHFDRSAVNLHALAQNSLGLTTLSGSSVAISINNVAQFSVSNGLFFSGNANGPQLRNAASSGTSCALNPDRSANTTGVGGNTGEVAFITGGVSRLTAADTLITATVNISTPGIVMGGHTVTDILVNGDGVSTLDAALVTAGYLDSLYLRDTDAYTHPNHSGDVTSVADGATTIAVNVVTNTKLADVATQTFKGRTTAATGDPEDLTVTQATAMLNTFGTSLKGLAPSSGGGTTNFLRADGSWVAPGGTHGNHTGDVTSVALVTTIATNVVTNAKLSNMVQSTIKGRAVSAGTGDPTDLTATQATEILNTFGTSLKGLAPSSGGGTTNFLRADGSWAAPPDTGVTDHGALSGLGDDDHSIYLKADSSRLFTGTFAATNANGPSLVNEVSTSVNPTLIPRKSDSSDGVGGGAGTVALITNNAFRLLVADTLITASVDISMSGMAMGGHTVTDIFISTDAPSTSDTTLVTAGYVEANTHYPPGWLEGLVTAYNTVSLADIAPGSCRDSTDVSNIVLTSTKSCNLDLSGAVNRLDTGSSASNTWYALYVIAKANGISPESLLSLSFTSPTLPSGYTIFRRVGAIYNRGGDIDKWHSRGAGRDREFIWDNFDSRARVLSSGTSTLYVDVNCTGGAPPSATKLSFYYEYLNNSSATRFFDVTLDGAPETMYRVRPVIVSATSTVGITTLIPCSSTQRVDYKVSNAATSLILFVMSWLDEL